MTTKLLASPFLSLSDSDDRFLEALNIIKRYKDIDDRSLCEPCIANKSVPDYVDDIKALVHYSDYVSMFDTTRCEGCDTTNDVVYLPLAGFHFETTGAYIDEWWLLFSRHKKDIEKYLVTHNI